MILNFLCLLALVIHELGLGDKGNWESTKRLKNFNRNLILTCNITAHQCGLRFESWEEIYVSWVFVTSREPSFQLAPKGFSLCILVLPSHKRTFWIQFRIAILHKEWGTCSSIKCRLQTIVFRVRKQWDCGCHVLIGMVKTIVCGLHFTVTA